MRSSIIITLLLSLFTTPAFSQATSDVKVVGYAAKKQSPETTPVKGYDHLGKAEYECIYQYDVLASKKNGEKEQEQYATILQFNPAIAKFTDLAAFRVDSLASIPGASGEAIDALSELRDKSEFFFSGEVFQNYPEGKTTYTDIIIPNYVEYTEDFAPFEWEITEDTLTVSSYPCVKATCEYGGRKWTAWFTEEIPVSYGPWKFSGLPGLIMKVSDDEGVHTFTATSFSKSGSEIVKVQNVNVQRTDRDKFIKNKIYIEEDPMRRIPVESITDITVKGADKNLWINGVPLVKRKNGYTPIELK